MMEANMQEASHGGVIPIADCSAPAFQSILEYLYVGSAVLPPEAVVDLLWVSSRYRLVGLAQQCELYIARHLAIEHLVDIYLLADTIQSHVLLNACQRLVESEWEQISALPEFKEFPAKAKEQFQTWHTAKLEADKPVKPEEPAETHWSRAVKESKSDLYSKVGFGRRDEPVQPSPPRVLDYYDYDSAEEDEDLAEYIYVRPK